MENNNNDFSMEKFSPAKAEVLKVVEAAKKTDLANIEEVHKNRIMVRDMRIDITKRGKELREGALKFQKDVIAREKELLAEIEPIERKLEAVEEEAKLKREMDKRRAELPSRHSALATILDNVMISDDELLRMNDAEFNQYRLGRIDAKLASDRAEFEAKKQKEEADRRAKQEAEDKERRAKLEAEEKELAAKKKAEDDRIAAENRKIEAEKARLAGIEEQRLKEEAARKAEVELKEREAKAEADRKALAEKEAKEAEEKRLAEVDYTNFLYEAGYTPKDELRPQPDGSVQLWRLLDTYKPKKK